MTADAKPPRDLARRVPLVEQQHDAAAQHRPLRCRPPSDPRFERGAAIGGRGEKGDIGVRDEYARGAARKKSEVRGWNQGRQATGSGTHRSPALWCLLGPRLPKAGLWSVYTLGTFEELYRQHVQAVFRYAMRVTGRKDTAEDLTSEAFLALYRNLEGIDQAQLPAWLLTVVRNRARDLWRHQEVEQRYAEQFSEPPHVDPGPMEQWILESR